MSALPTAPGVHIVEVPSGTRSIAGVSTSLTAFVGSALRGPTDDPTFVSSWSEYEDRFGGLWVHSLASHVVRQYFLEGGAQALIVRVVNRDAMALRATDAVAALGDFAHLVVTVDGATTSTFDLDIAAVDDQGDVLSINGNEVSASATIDLGAPDPRSVIEALAADGTALVEVVGDVITQPPPNGAWTTTDPGTGDQTVTIGARATTATATVHVGLTLQVTDEATALAGFDHLVATVSNSDADAGTFDLRLDAVDAGGDVLDDGASGEYTVTAAGLDAGEDYAGTIAALTTGTAPPIPLAEVVGTTPGTVPPDGTAASDDDHRVLLATTQLELAAVDPGAWGNRVRARVHAEEAQPGTFHLVLTEVDDTGAVVDEEVHYHVTTAATAPRALGRLLELRSRLAHLTASSAATDHLGTAAAALEGGGDGGPPRRIEDLLGSDRTGMNSLVEADLFNLLCLPLDAWSSADASDQQFWGAAIDFCEEHRAFLLIDPPVEWTTAAQAADGAAAFSPRSDHAALYFPRVRVPDPLREGRLADYPPCGVVAGVIARTDAQRGVWKAPAGIEAGLRSVPELAVRMTDPDHGRINPLGVNVLRTFPVYGRVVWGARTLDGADVQASEWKYVPVRRLALFLEESLLRGTRWAVFEPNDYRLWSQLRLAVGGFMHQLFRQGAFAGATPRDAYLVKCDAETTTQLDIDRGVVNVLVGFAPLRPAEFVIIKLQQLAAQAG